MFLLLSCEYLQFLSAGRRTTEQKGRELNAPPPEAPRSACAENEPSRARLGARSVGPLHIENSRFSDETVAGATLNFFDSVYIDAHNCALLTENAWLVNALASGFLCSLPAFLSAQQSVLHIRPVVQATSADLDIREDSGCFPVAQSPAADWQFRQQLLLVNEASLACRCLVLDAE